MCRKGPTKRNAAAASSHYLNYDQPDTTSTVCLCHVNPYIVNKIQLQINTLSLETPQLSRVHHLQIHQQFMSSGIHQTTFLREASDPVILGQHQTRAKHRMRQPDTKQGTGYQRRSARTANVRKTRQHRTCDMYRCVPAPGEQHSNSSGNINRKPGRSSWKLHLHFTVNSDCTMTDGMRTEIFWTTKDA